MCKSLLNYFSLSLYAWHFIEFEFYKFMYCRNNIEIYMKFYHEEKFLLSSIRYNITVKNETGGKK